MTLPSQTASTETSSSERLKIWDVWIRAWHWLTVILIVSLWATAELRMMDLHILLGIAMAGLTVFRIAWGFLGTRTARFTIFFTSPKTLLQYLRTVISSAYKPPAGHSPIGALSALALILALLLQVLSGLFSVNTDGMHSGPLARFVSFADARLAGNVHEAAFNILVALIALHLLAIFFYSLLKRAKLVGPMLTGWRKASDTQAGARSTTRPRLIHVIASLSIGTVTSLVLYAV